MRHEMNLPLEIRVIKKFFKKEKQERYIAFVSSGRSRKKLLQQLSHLRDLQWNLFEEVNYFEPGTVAHIDEQSCYVISDDPSVDQRSISISEANRLCESGEAFILVFGDAERVYYQGEAPFNRYFSKV